ncbi:hypothetical protein ACH41H_35110 [Streptomyces sp. NPDC020800]|uniref:hypothetical protein n=1 Tax=Streptomyces sp. NPDC020800 TaxID=3365092 RepID=UPI00379CD77D
MSKITAAVVSSGRTVRVAPYVLASSGEERRAGLALIERYVIAAGLSLAEVSFADTGAPPPIDRRTGWRAVRRYAERGFAHGIVAIARPAITTDVRVYEGLLTDLFVHRLFLALLPTEDSPGI